MKTYSYSAPKKSLVVHALVLMCAISIGGLLSGCDGGTYLKGVVLDSNDTPIGDANVKLTTGERKREVKSSDRGVFKIGMTHSPFNPELTLEVTKPGFKPFERRFHPKDHLESIVATLEPAASLPTGWIYAPSRLQNSELWRCAAYGGSWAVNNDDGSVRLVRIGAESREQAPLPPPLKLSKKMIGRRSLQATSSGWLAGFDAGEFGGGLWWFSRDGSQTVELLSENVHAIYQIERGILILTGLDHMGLNYGHLYRFNDVPGKPTVTSLADFGGSPEASTVDSGGIIIATPERVLRVDKDGKINEMYKSGEHLTYPTSAAVDANGVVYVAMRFFVLRLIPQQAFGYNAEWLMPEQCRVFKLDEYICNCNAK
jgi:hypothetical protein